MLAFASTRSSVRGKRWGGTDTLGPTPLRSVWWSAVAPSTESGRRATTAQARAAPSLSRNCAVVYVAITADSRPAAGSVEHELADAEQGVGEHEHPRAGGGQPARGRRERRVEMSGCDHHRREHRGVAEDRTSQPAVPCVAPSTPSPARSAPRTAATAAGRWIEWSRATCCAAGRTRPGRPGGRAANDPVPTRNGPVPSPSRATSPPHPPAWAASVVVRSGESAARGEVTSDAASVGISSGLVTNLAR